MQKIVSAMLIVVGLIHLLPVTGVLGSDRLAALYGMSFSQPDLLIMMRHRAVLFGILGLFLIYAAFYPAFQPAALAAGIVSVVSFLVIAVGTGGYNDAIGRVVYADLVALACLIVASAIFAYGYRQQA